MRRRCHLVRTKAGDPGEESLTNGLGNYTRLVLLAIIAEIRPLMELKDVVSVSGLPGLHKIIGRNKNGLIVETIGENGKKFATNLRQRVSVLADIAIFTNEGEAKLWEVLKTIKGLEDGGTTIPNSKVDNDEAKAFMRTILPDFDEEKVYVSDMKKLFGWYHLLRPELDFEKLGQEEEEHAEGEKTETPVGITHKEKGAPKQIKTSGPKTQSGAKVKTTTPRKMGS
jgi:hypothetical protein